MKTLKIDLVCAGELRQGAEPFLSLLKLDEGYLDYPWKTSHWLELGRKKDETLLLILSRGAEFCGFVLFTLNPWARQAHLLKIVIKPDLRGSGAAHELFAQARSRLKETGIKEIFLEVSALNGRAIAFYLRNGFRELCVKKGFYSDGVDARALLLSL